MRKEKLITGGYYHIYNRGVNFENIFFQEQNWYFFLDRLKRYFTPNKVEILAYCLMPNHYHLLVQVKTDDIGIQVVHPFAISYTKAINKQQERVGPLFQGPYQVRSVNNPNDLIHLSSYIHNNPVAAGFVQAPEEWEFSSYLEYIGERRGSLPKVEVVLTRFKNRLAYADFVKEGLDKRLPLTLLID